MCSVHGDDFTSCGAKNQLDCFEDKLEAHYELKGLRGEGREFSKAVVQTVIDYIYKTGKLDDKMDARFAQDILAIDEKLKIDYIREYTKQFLEGCPEVCLEPFGTACTGSAPRGPVLNRAKLSPRSASAGRSATAAPTPRSRWPGPHRPRPPRPPATPPSTR